MQIERRYTEPGGDPFAGLKFAPRTSRIVNPDGSVVFEMKDLLAPDHWSQVAVDILAQKYFRKAGVPLELAAASPEDGVPGVAAAQRAGGRRLAGAARRPTPGRCSAAWPAAGRTGAGRAATSRPRPTRRRSTTRSATCWPTQMAAPNSPQWFNTGLHWAYGIEGPPQGHYYVDPATAR